MPWSAYYKAKFCLPWNMVLTRSLQNNFLNMFITSCFSILIFLGLECQRYHTKNAVCHNSLPRPITSHDFANDPCSSPQLWLLSLEQLSVWNTLLKRRERHCDSQLLADLSCWNLLEEKRVWYERQLTGNEYVDLCYSNATTAVKYSTREILFSHEISQKAVSFMKF